MGQISMNAGMEEEQSFRAPVPFGQCCREAATAVFWMASPFLVTGALTAANFAVTTAMAAGCTVGAYAIYRFLRWLDRPPDPRISPPDLP